MSPPPTSHGSRLSAVGSQVEAAGSPPPVVHIPAEPDPASSTYRPQAHGAAVFQAGLPAASPPVDAPGTESESPRRERRFRRRRRHYSKARRRNALLLAWCVFVAALSAAGFAAMKLLNAPSPMDTAPPANRPASR
jgi:hypothetical protein